MFRDGIRESSGPSDLRVGAVADGQGLKRAGNTLVGAAMGDVVGPSSATDESVARFDGATGKLLQNSAVRVDDSGNIVTATDVFARNLIGSASVFCVDVVNSGNVFCTGGQFNGINIATLAAFMPQIRVLGATVNSTSTTPATVAGLTFSSIVAGTYVFFYSFVISTAVSTTGYRLTHAFSGSSGTYARGVLLPTTDGLAAALDGSIAGKNTLSSNPFTSGLNASSDGVLALWNGSIVVTSTGNLTMAFGSEVAGSTASMIAGSFAVLLRAS
jgi:hypothetical protein